MIIIDVKAQDITPAYRYKKLYFRLNEHTRINCSRFFGALIIVGSLIGLICSVVF